MEKLLNLTHIITIPDLVADSKEIQLVQDEIAEYVFKRVEKIFDGQRIWDATTIKMQAHCNALLYAVCGDRPYFKIIVLLQAKPVVRNIGGQEHSDWEYYYNYYVQYL